MFGMGIGEMAVIAGIAFLFLGPKKLPELGSAVGKSIKNFKVGMKNLDTTEGENKWKQNWLKKS